MSTLILNVSPPMDISEINKALTTTRAAYDYVASRGLSMLPRPDNKLYEGRMPPHMVDMDDRILGDLLNEIASWCSYVNSELSMIRAAREEAEEKLKSLQSRLRLSIKMSLQAGSRKLSNPEMDDIVNSDARIVEAKGVYLTTMASCDMIKQLSDNSQRDWDTVSRRITQRGQEIERNRRTEGVGSVPVMAGAFRRS